MKSRLVTARTIVDLPLPGDEETFLAARIRFSIRRERRLNTEERLMYACVAFRVVHDLDFCLVYECPFCGGL
ncbi:hypothetical protein C6N75_09700 [Streptomyces solincola]|uniref:Uncharacterized protein n=1 Tax=Streptomyces solincola TaxID=2100817 RepID=A0A2S9PY61_9ACTN|nr:hypothetical protein C6N75_09700 [Streptomyces solincola]